MKRGTAALLAFAALLLLCSTHHIAADSPSFGLTAVCDPGGMIPGGSPFWGHLGFLLQQLADNTPYTPNYSFKTRVGGGDAPAFGEAYCQPSCLPEKCDACLHQLSTDIWRICNSALGARVEYPDCWIHYKCSYF